MHLTADRNRAEQAETEEIGAVICRMDDCTDLNLAVMCWGLKELKHSKQDLISTHLYLAYAKSAAFALDDPFIEDVSWMERHVMVK